MSRHSTIRVHFEETKELVHPCADVVTSYRNLSYNKAHHNRTRCVLGRSLRSRPCARRYVTRGHDDE